MTCSLSYCSSIVFSVPAATSYGWRAIRAGKATEMARTPGVTLSRVMAAGEWQSASVLRYLREPDLHTERFLEDVLDASDAEDALMDDADVPAAQEV